MYMLLPNYRCSFLYGEARSECSYQKTCQANIVGIVSHDLRPATHAGSCTRAEAIGIPCRLRPAAMQLVNNQLVGCLNEDFVDVFCTLIFYVFVL